MRTTQNLLKVAVALMRAPTGQHWGYVLAQRAGVFSGTLYPLLRRLESEGWLAAGWEDPATITDGRPPRRYYTLTPTGRSELGALAALALSTPTPSPRRSHGR